MAKGVANHRDGGRDPTELALTVQPANTARPVETTKYHYPPAGYGRVPPAVFSRFRNVKATDNVVVVAAIDTAFVMISSRLAIDMPYAK